MPKLRECRNARPNLSKIVFTSRSETAGVTASVSSTYDTADFQHSSFGQGTPNIWLSVNTGMAGTPVTVGGTNLGSGGVLTFNGTTATSTVSPAGELVTSVPVSATTGNVVLVVSGVASNGVVFTIPQAVNSALVCSPSSAQPGATVICSASVHTSATNAAISTVNGQPIGSAYSDTLGLATLPVSMPPVAGASVTVAFTYGGDSMGNPPSSGSTSIRILPGGRTSSSIGV